MIYRSLKLTLKYVSYNQNFQSSVKKFVRSFSSSCEMPIKSVFARNIFDSRGNPTVEVDLITDLGLFRAAVPSGASTGKQIITIFCVHIQTIP